MDALANPSLQRSLHTVLAVVTVVGAATFLIVLLTARRQMAPAGARVSQAHRRRQPVHRHRGRCRLCAAGDAGRQRGGRGPAPVAAGAETADGRAAADDTEVVSARRFSSAKLPALSLDAPDGWTLEADKAGHKVSISSDKARLLVSTAILTEAVDVEALLRS